MATQPGSPAAAMPASEDTLMRRVADIERALRELGPSIARSFSGTVTELRAAQDALTTQQADLTAALADLAVAQQRLSTPAQASNSRDGAFTIPNMFATPDRASVSTSIAVPEGATSCALMVVGFAGANNTDTAPHPLSAWLDAGLPGWFRSTTIGAKEIGTLTVPAVGYLASLGASIDITLSAQCNAGAGEFTFSNRLDVSALAFFQYQ